MKDRKMLLRSVILFLVFVVAPTITTPLPAAARNLEDMIEGKRAARGVVRVRPGSAAERLFCRLVGERADAARFALKGRCATPSQSGEVRIDFTVLVPGKRYEMTISIKSEQLLGYLSAYRYTGVATGNRVDFATVFPLDGETYRSNVRVLLGHAGVERIVETVTAESDGRRTMLFDLKITRE